MDDTSLDTLKTHLDAAWNQLVRSDLYRRAITEATATYRESRESPRIYLRLDELESSIFQLAALMSDDDIAEMLDTIANEKDVKMAEYKLPAEPDGPLWDKNGDKWVRNQPDEWETTHTRMRWDEALKYWGPFTDAPPIKVGDTGLTADPLPGLEGTDLNRKVRDEIYRQLSGHYGDFNVPTQKEAQAVIDAVAGHLLNAVPDDSADDVREALGL